ncbi:MAG: hypothetical protein JWN52_6617 [Actinomycetia bacterium]|nr:hypothetical protein [Actinomycetes bacterium]
MTARCRVIFIGSPCSEDAIYVVHIADCPVCAGLGWLFCCGHSMCVQHGAGMRADEYVYHGDDEPVVTAERIRAVYPVTAVKAGAS